MLQLYPRSGAVHLLNAIDRPLLLVEGNAGPWTQTPFKKYVCFSFSFWNVAGQPEGAGGTLPVAGDCHPSDSAGAEALHGAAAPALPVAAVDLRPAGLLAEKVIVCIFFFVTLQARQRGLEGRCQSLVTIPLTQQDPTETCLTYRLFAVRQLHQRYRRLRLFFAQLVCRVAARAHPTRHLCGVDSDADERVKMLGACLMLGAVEEACLRWTAVEGMDREVSRRSFGRGRGRGARRGCLFLFTF